MCKEAPLSDATLRFVRAHRRDDVRTLALQAAKYPDVDMPEAVVQIAGWQAAERKIPWLAQTEGIRYPRHLSMEQCSSELTARRKASLVSGESFADLTAGFGVDCCIIAQRFRTADYVERQAELCALAQHNFPLLGMTHIRIHHTDGMEYLKRMNPVDCLFLDPARRDSHGGKTVLIADCEPNVAEWEPLLLQKAETVMVKLSPMLDITSALQDLKNITSLHIIAVHNECKEMVALLKKNVHKANGDATEAVISCEQLVENSDCEPFEYRLSEEREAHCLFASEISDYLYEPGAALLKAGPYKLLSVRYGVEKLHANSHLYTLGKLVDFPGRRFKVLGVAGFGKRELKDFLRDVPKANLTVRNFPVTVAELRKRLKLKEGGDIYLFATTMGQGDRVLIKCHRV